MHNLPWSYSKLSLYKKCPAAFKFRYIDKIKAPDNKAAARGSAVHKNLETFVSSPNATESIALLLADVKPSMLEGLMALRDAYKMDYIDLEMSIKLDWQWNEVDSYNEAWGMCIFDVVDFKNCKIIDYKTGRSYPSHRGQALIYALAFQRVTGTTPKVEFWYLEQGVVEDWEFTNSQLDFCEDDLKKTLLEIDSDTTWECSGEGCNWCEFRKGGYCV